MAICLGEAIADYLSLDLAGWGIVEELHNVRVALLNGIFGLPEFVAERLVSVSCKSAAALPSFNSSSSVRNPKDILFYLKTSRLKITLYPNPKDITLPKPQQRYVFTF